MLCPPGLDLEGHLDLAEMDGELRKTRFITLSNSYHGETLGALAVGNVELYKSIYRPLLMDVITVPSPDALTVVPDGTP